MHRYIKLALKALIREPVSHFEIICTFDKMLLILKIFFEENSLFIN